MDLEVFVTKGLGDASYLLASGDEAALVDPQRDAWRFLAVAAARGWRVTTVLETHVHNDYVSGAHEVRAATGAELVVPARGGYAFDHRAADEGDEFPIGDLRLVARATPGHTPEHLAWEVAGATPDAPAAVFSGGSLLVGSAGRTDLLGPEAAKELTPAQFRTLRRLASLPDATRILPTHGAGSFCAAGPTVPARTTTVGDERLRNPLLRFVDESSFGTALLGSVGRFPDYYRHMAPINRAGPPVLGRLPIPAALDPSAVERAVAAGARVIDARDRRSFAAAHIPGSLNIELSSSFAAYVGWLLEYDSPVVLVVPDRPSSALEEAAVQLFRIGWRRIEGVLDGSIDAWARSGRALSSYGTTTMPALAAEATSGTTARLLDVRQPIEWRDDGVIASSETIFVADLPGRLEELRDAGEVTVLCRTGQRAAIAASILDGAGISVRLVAEDGAVGWTDRFPGSS